MGNKRRREKSKDRLRNKIRKLETKLKGKRRVIVYSSSSEDEAVDSCQTATSPAHDGLPPLMHSSTPGPSPASPMVLRESNILPLDEGILKASEDRELDDETLTLLGEAPYSDSIYGKVVHKDLAARWQEILKKGLSKEAKDNLFKSYLIPANCTLLLPPILNHEAKAAISDAFVKRDASMMFRQKHISVVVSALSQSIDRLINNADQDLNKDLLKPLSDACRILCDMHHYESKIRKKCIISTVNTDLKDTLVNSNTDKYLFGHDMSDRLKTAKSVQKSGDALKVNHKPVMLKDVSYKVIDRNPGNFKNLHRTGPGVGRIQSGPRQQHQRAYYTRGQRAGHASQTRQTQPPPRRSMSSRAQTRR